MIDALFATKEAVYAHSKISSYRYGLGKSFLWDISLVVKTFFLTTSTKAGLQHDFYPRPSLKPQALCITGGLINVYASLPQRFGDPNVTTARAPAGNPNKKAKKSHKNGKGNQTALVVVHTRKQPPAIVAALANCERVYIDLLRKAMNLAKDFPHTLIFFNQN